MGRLRRCIHSGKVYEICFRTRKGLPFVATQYMRAIIGSVMARVQRSDKVTLCHFLWMGNHVHIIVVAKDAEQCTRFYGEIQKQLTEAVKRLTGRKNLSLWKSNAASVILYGDAQSVIKRIAYLYANPAAADLEDSIEKYPGFSSYELYLQATNAITAAVFQTFTLIKARMLCRLPRASLSKAQDIYFLKKITAGSHSEQKLTLYPNAWMKAFDIEDSSVAEINSLIIEFLRENEAEARYIRSINNKRVKGAHRLISEPLDLEYETQSKSRRIFVYADSKSIRTNMIAEYKQFCEQCVECYKRLKAGDYAINWPPGAFVPSIPLNFNWWCAA